MMSKPVRRIAMVGGIALIACGSLFGYYRIQAAQQDKDKLDAFMQEKLEISKQILEGLATDDMEQVAQGAQQLAAISLESAWNTHTTAEYIAKSEDFRRSLSIIREGARSKNTDRATLGYINMTVQCVECHRYLRSNPK
jgi:pantoate kinase